MIDLIKQYKRYWTIWASYLVLVVIIIVSFVTCAAKPAQVVKTVLVTSNATNNVTGSAYGYYLQVVQLTLQYSTLKQNFDTLQSAYNGLNIQSETIKQQNIVLQKQVEQQQGQINTLFNNQQSATIQTQFQANMRELADARNQRDKYIKQYGWLYDYALVSSNLTSDNITTMLAERNAQ